MSKFNYRIFQIIVGITALSLAGAAAYFSVFGLSKLFVGASIAGIIMFSIIEIAKIVSVSYLYRFWEFISWARKSYMLLGVIVLMLITSLGIYGFLSASYQETSTKLQLIHNEVNVLENRKLIYVEQIDNINQQIENRNNRIQQLVDLRSQQEVRLDSLYQRQHWQSVRRTEENIQESNQTINTLSNEISELSQNIVSLNDSINNYNNQILILQNYEDLGDIGPLEYISELIDIPMDNVVNYLILLIIFVFDPMAIALLIAFNHISVIISKRKEDDEDNNDEDKDENTPITLTKVILEDNDKNDVVVDEINKDENDTLNEPVKDEELVKNNDSVKDDEPLKYIDHYNYLKNFDPNTIKKVEPVIEEEPVVEEIEEEPVVEKIEEEPELNPEDILRSKIDNYMSILKKNVIKKNISPTEIKPYIQDSINEFIKSEKDKTIRKKILTEIEDNHQESIMEFIDEYINNIYKKNKPIPKKKVKIKENNKSPENYGQYKYKKTYKI